MDWMISHLIELSMAAAVAWGAGIRLYLVVLIVGLAGKFGYITIPENMVMLQHNAVIGAAGLMTFVEFFADKIPYLDSVWDFIHTIIRIPAGAALAAGMLGDSSQGVALAAALMGGTLAATSHFGKAGARAVINTSPEPVSNIAASFAEESMVVGGLALAVTNPLLFLVLLLVFLVVVVLMLRWLLGAIKRLFNQRRSPAPAAQLSST
jgi:Domain of unknown function (DUF4126)